MNIWTYCAMLGEASRYAEIGLNMTRDKELKQALSMAADSCTKQSIKRPRRNKIKLLKSSSPVAGLFFLPAEN